MGESVACCPVGRVTLRFVKGENRPIVLGGRADRPSTAAARLGGRWRLCDVAPSQGRGPLRREDGVRPGNRRKDGTEAVKSIAHHLRSDGCRWLAEWSEEYSTTSGIVHCIGMR